jgi:hypothetical protein
MAPSRAQAETRAEIHNTRKYKARLCWQVTCRTTRGKCESIRHSSRSGRNGHSNFPLRYFQNKGFDSLHSSWSRIILNTNSKSLDGSNSIKISKSISSVIPRKIYLILGEISPEIFVNATFFK